MNFKEICRKENISPSFTRMHIYNYLKNSKEHPTVDMIYKFLKPDLPTLSKTTVYNVLDLFAKHKIIKPIHLDSGESRFEVIGQRHSHFKCNVCGKIYDIPQVQVNISSFHYKGFKIESEEVVLKGICDQCSNDLDE